MAETIDLTPEAASVGAARRFVAAHLDAWGASVVVDAAVLLTSELVTNSVLHARTDIEVVVERLGEDRVQISVRDGSSHAPRRGRRAQDATTGRGIELLDKLAESWEVITDNAGKTVRFILTGDSDPWAEVRTMVADSGL